MDERARQRSASDGRSGRRAAVGLWMAACCGCGAESTPSAAPALPAANEVRPALRPATVPPPAVDRWGAVEDLPQPLALFDTVFWEPLDTTSLRQLLRETELVRGKSVLEIGTGSGLVALCCLQAGAARVVATDLNPNAINCAAYNAQRLKLEQRLELRLVRQDAPQAFAVIGPDERFDVIISNPPWEDATPKSIDEFALYDRSFALMNSLLDGLPDHLQPGGRVLLAYGCVTAIRTLEQQSRARGYEYRVHDDRDLSQLPEVFLPGMLIELRLLSIPTTPDTP